MGVERMTKQEAIKILRNTAWLGTNEDREKTEQAVEVISKALEQEPIIRCEDCKHHGTSNCPMWGDDTTEDYMWCCDGEKMESDE